MRREKEQRSLFQLIKSVLLQEPITIEVEGLDWKYLQQLCKYQKIDNLVSYGILPLQEQEKIPADVVCAMQKAQQKGIAREALAVPEGFRELIIFRRSLCVTS